MGERPAPDLTSVEVRIHGVGGETPYVTLGLGDDRSAIDPHIGREKSYFYERRPSRGRFDPDHVTVRAYNWAKLTSRSRYAPLWPLLLPFTFLNIAGFMHRSHRGDPREQVIRRLVKWLGYATTAAWGTWIAGLALQPPGSVALRTVVVALVFLALYLVARFTEEGFENKPPPRRLLEDRPAGELSLQDAKMWDWPDWIRSQHRVHALIGAVPALLLAANRGWIAPFDFSDLLVFVMSVQTLLLLLLAGWAIADGFVGGIRHASGPFTAAAVGVGMSHGYLSSFGWGLERLGVTSLPTFGEQIFEMAGYGAATTAIAAAGLVLVVVGPGLFRPPIVTPDAPAHDPVPGAVTPRRTALAQRSARLLRNMGWVLTPAAIAFSIVLLVRVGGHLAATWPLPFAGAFAAAGRWLEEPGVLQSLARWAAAGTPWAVAALCAAMLASYRVPALRRQIAILWDVLTFWPRWHHPFAVRSYAERAVPELQEEILRDLADHDRVVVSAHSQGAVLAWAAVAPIAALEEARRICVVTFGSPLSTLHSRFFPAWVEPERLRRVHARLGSWRNFYRLTDYIGQRVEGLPDADNVECPEPPSTDDLDDGPRWDDELPVRLTTGRLLRHSAYRSEPALRSAVTTLLTEREVAVATPAPEASQVVAEAAAPGSRRAVVLWPWRRRRPAG